MFFRVVKTVVFHMVLIMIYMSLFSVHRKYTAVDCVVDDAII